MLTPDVPCLPVEDMALGMEAAPEFHQRVATLRLVELGFHFHDAFLTPSCVLRLRELGG
jgi:hypothetical protein